MPLRSCKSLRPSLTCAHGASIDRFAAANGSIARRARSARVKGFAPQAPLRFGLSAAQPSNLGGGETGLGAHCKTVKKGRKERSWDGRGALCENSVSNVVAVRWGVFPQNIFHFRLPYVLFRGIISLVVGGAQPPRRGVHLGWLFGFVPLCWCVVSVCRARCVRCFGPVWPGVRCGCALAVVSRVVLAFGIACARVRPCRRGARCAPRVIVCSYCVLFQVGYFTPHLFNNFTRQMDSFKV
jgi:hypothetical protein